MAWWSSSRCWKPWRAYDYRRNDPRTDRPAPVDARRIRQDRRHPRPRAKLYRAGYLLGDVERALLLQELPPAPEEAADSRQTGGARAGRERRDRRYRWRLR